jgi:hypothetical protein
MEDGVEPTKTGRSTNQMGGAFKALPCLEIPPTAPTCVIGRRADIITMHNIHGKVRHVQVQRIVGPSAQLWEWIRNPSH